MLQDYDSCQVVVQSARWHHTVVTEALGDRFPSAVPTTMDESWVQVPAGYYDIREVEGERLYLGGESRLFAVASPNAHWQLTPKNVSASVSALHVAAIRRLRRWRCCGCARRHEWPRGFLGAMEQTLFNGQGKAAAQDLVPHLLPVEELAQLFRIVSHRLLEDQTVHGYLQIASSQLWLCRLTSAAMYHFCAEDPMLFQFQLKHALT